MALKDKQGPEHAPTRRLVYGVNPVLEALRARPDEIERLRVAEGSLTGKSGSELLARARSAGIALERVPRQSLSSLAQGGAHQGVVAQLREFRYATLEELMAGAQSSGRPLLAIALDNIQDPQNLGAIIRSAHAFGVQGVIIPQDRSAQVTPAVAKASAGAIEHCQLVRVVNLSRALEELKQAGAWVMGAVSEGGEKLSEVRLAGPLVVVIGGEANGIRRGVLKHCDLQVSIPMPGGIGSLNASVAAGIILYEIARRLERGGPV